MVNYIIRWRAATGARNQCTRKADIRIQPHNKNYRWLVVAMLWLVCFFNYAERQAIFSVYPLIKTQLHLSDMQLGLIASSFMWMYALCGPFAGWLCDRVPRKITILSALIFWSLVTACISFSKNAVQLAALTALGGLGEAFYFPAAMSLLSDYHAPDTRSRAMSLHQTGVYAGTIGGGAIAGLLGQYFGFRSSFLYFGLVGILVGLLLLAMLREPVRGGAEMSPPSEVLLSHTKMHTSFLLILGQPVVLLLMAAFIGANFVAVVFLTWMPTFLYQKFHMTLALAGLNATAYLQIASMAGVVCGGVLADSSARRRPGGRISTQAMGVLLAVPFLFLTGWTTSVFLLAAGLICFGFCKGIYDANIFAGLYDVVPVEHRGASAGLMNSLGWLGGGFAPLCIAMGTKYFGMSLCFSATAVIYLVVAIFLLFASRRMQCSSAE